MSTSENAGGGSDAADVADLVTLLRDEPANLVWSDWADDFRVPAMRRLAATLVREQIEMTASQRDALLRLVRGTVVKRRGTWLDPEWIAVRLLVDGVQTPQGAEMAAATARQRELSALLKVLVNRHRHQLSAPDLDSLLKSRFGGEFGLAVPQLVLSLAGDRVPVTRAERDDLARAVELVGPQPNAGMPDPEATIAALNVVDGDT